MHPVDDSHMLRRVFDSIPALIGYWGADLRNVEANTAYQDFFGLRPGDVRGMHMREVLGEELYESVRHRVESALRGEVQNFDQTWIAPAGGVQHFQVSYVPDVLNGTVHGFFVHLVEVTERARAEHQRDEAMRLFETTMHHAPIGKAVTTAGGRWLHVNAAMSNLLGYTTDELRSTSLREVTHPDDLRRSDDLTAQLLDGTRDTIQSEKRYVRRDGSVVWVQWNSVIVRSVDGPARDDDVIIEQVQDITRRRYAESELARQAVTDALTGLGNRHFLMAQIAELSRRSPAGVGLLFFDVDDFKSVNDSFGHAIGDELLIEVARRLDYALAPGDTACRVGGDEFVVVTADVGPVALENYRQTLKRAVSGQYSLPSAHHPITVSVSVGASATGDDDHVGLLNAADHRMYADKIAARRRRSDSGHGDPERTVAR